MFEIKARGSSVSREVLGGITTFLALSYIFFQPALLSQTGMDSGGVFMATCIAIGFIAYAFGKIVTGRVRQCPVIVYVFTVLFVLRYALAR